MAVHPPYSFFRWWLNGMNSFTFNWKMTNEKVIYTIRYSRGGISSVTVPLEYREYVTLRSTIDNGKASFESFDIFLIFETLFYGIVTSYYYMLRSHYSSRSFHFSLEWISVGPLFKVVS